MIRDQPLQIQCNRLLFYLWFLQTAPLMLEFAPQVLKL